MKPSILCRALKQYKSASDEYKYQPKYDSQRVFDDIEETGLVNYIVSIAQMHYGLTHCDIRELGFKFARSKGKKYPKSWDKKYHV